MSIENVLDTYGFTKVGLHHWVNEQFEVIRYYDSLYIQEVYGEDTHILYEGLTPINDLGMEDLVEKHTKLKKIHDNVIKLLDSTKSSRIYTNTSLYISNVLIQYIKFNSTSEEDLCKKLSVSKERLSEFMSGSCDYTLGEISRISVLLNKTITIK